VDAQVGDGAWIIYNADGSRHSSQRLYHDQEFELGAGEYFLVAVGYSADENYAIHLVKPDLTETAISLDTVISGEIEKNGDVDSFTFTGRAGQQLFYDALGSEFFYLALYDPQSQEIFRQVDARHDRAPHQGFTLDMDGTYTLKVGGSRIHSGRFGPYNISTPYTGPYQFQLLDRDQAPEAPLDQDITGIFGHGARASVAHRLNLTERTYLYVDGQAGDGAWLIYDSAGALVRSARLYQDSEFWLETGDYLVVAQGYGGNENYSFRLITPELTSTEITYGQVISGSLTELGQQDAFTFIGKAGDKLFYDALGGTFDRQVLLQDPTGTLLYSNVDPRHDRGPNHVLTLNQDGVYTLTLDGVATRLGDYQFQLLNWDDAPEVALDTDIQGTLAAEALASTAHRFNLRERTYLYVDGQEGDGAWLIYNGSGALVHSARLYQDREFWLEAGEYWLVAQGYGGNEHYNLRLITPDLNTTAIGYGAIIEGSLREKGQQDTFTFTGKAGEMLFYDVLGWSGGLSIALYDPTGTLLYSANPHLDRGPGGNLFLNRNGTYRIVIDAPGANLGDYRFQFLEKDSSPTIQLDQVLSGTLGEGARESRGYRFNLSERQYIYVDAQAGNGAWIIYNAANGSLVSSARLYEDRELWLEAGEYWLVAQGHGSDAEYGVELISPAHETIALDYGTLVTGALTEKGQRDTYTFRGQVGQLLLMDTITRSTSNFWARFYSPSGRLLVNTRLDADWSPLVLQEGGEYRLEIDIYGSETGDYSFILHDRDQASIAAIGDTITNQLTQENGLQGYQIQGRAGQVLEFDLLDQVIDPSTGHVYALTPIADTWEKAQAAAQAAGGTLATITGAEENAIIGQLLQGTGVGRAWIGLNDVAEEGNWVWDNGEPLGYTRWAAGEPNNSSNSDYAEIVAPSWRWNDTLSTYSRYGVIEFENATAPISGTTRWPEASWQLYDPAGRLVRSAGNGRTEVADFTTALALNGIYTLVVAENAETPIDYSFSLTDVTPAPVLNTGLGSIETVSHGVGEIGSYTFTAAAGTTLQYDGQAGAGINRDSRYRMRLVNPDGTYAWGDGEAMVDRGPLILHQSGEYRLEFYDRHGSAALNHQFQLLELPKRFGPGINYLEVGNTTTGTLENGETKVYSFESIPGLTVMFNGMVGHGVNANLYDSGGNRIFNHNNFTWGDNGFHTLTQGGMHHLVISGDLGASRDYSFQLLDATTAPEIDYNVPLRDSLANGQESQVYRFQAEAGQTLFFDNLSYSDGHQSGRVQWSVSGPGNQVLANNHVIRTDFDLRIPTTGEYKLHVRGSDVTTPLDYQFRVFAYDEPQTIGQIVPGSGEDSANADGSLGEFAVSLEVTDNRGAAAHQDYTIRLWPDPDNANPVILSEPTLRFGLDDPAYRYPIAALDPNEDDLTYRLINGPLGALVNNETGELLWFPEASVVPGTTVDFTVEVSDGRGGIDQQTFGVEVYQALGQIQGAVFDDLNHNGLRDSKLIKGDNPAIVLALDVSGSTGAPFYGGPNYDHIETVLDAQREATLALVDSIIAQGAGDSLQIGLIPHEFNATIQDMNPWTPELDPYTTALADANNNGIADIREILAGDLYRIPRGSNRFQVALEQIDDLFTALPGTPNLIFMSDGYDSHRHGGLNPQVAADIRTHIQGRGGNITAFAMGEASTLETLEKIDPDAIQLTDIDELVGIFSGFDDRYAIEPLRENITVYLDLNNNGELDETEPFQLTGPDPSPNTLGENPYHYHFDQLLPGDYTVRTLIPNGYELTAPDSGAWNEAISSDGETIPRLFGIAQTEEPANTDPVFITMPQDLYPLESGDTLHYKAQARDGDGDPVTYELILAPEGMAVAADTGEVVWSPTAQQREAYFEELRETRARLEALGRGDASPTTVTFNVLLKAQDDRGGQSLQTLAIELVPDNNAPVFTSPPPETAQPQVDKPFAYQAKALDPDGDDLILDLVSAPPGATLDPETGLVSWTPAPGQEGDQTFEIKSEDDQGNTIIQTFTVQVVEPTTNRDPLISSLPRIATRPGTAYFYAIEATDPDGDPLTYSLNQGPDGLSLSGNQITWVPNPEQFGLNPVVLTVDDGQGGSVTQSFSIGVSQIAPNYAPIITSTPEVLVTTVDRNYQTQLAGYDPDGDLTLWSLVTGPVGMIVDPETGILGWQPRSVQLGHHEVTVQLTDSYGLSTQQAFELAVQGLNTPPRIVSSANTQGAAGQPYHYIVVAHDLEGDALTYHLVQRPEGTEIDQQTGEITWANPRTGSHEIILQVRDAYGAATTQEYDLEVGEVPLNQAPVIGSTPIFTVDTNGEYRYPVVATDADGDALFYEIIDGPTGVTIDAEGLVTWSEPVAGNHRIVIGVRDDQGLGAAQGYQLVAQANQAPVLRSTTPPATAIADTEYAYDVIAQNPEGGELTYELDPESVAKGITLDDRGRLRWTPSQDQTGDHDIGITITDPTGGTLVQAFTVSVTLDQVAPLLNFQYAGSNPTDLNSTVRFLVQGSDDVGLADLWLTIEGEAILLDGLGQAAVLMDTAGSIEAVATAVDLAGNQTQETITFSVLDPNSEAPVVSFADSLANQVFTAPTDIFGSVTDGDGDLQSYRLEAALLGTDQFQTIFEGTDGVSNGVLGQFDPTLLQNDTYTLRLTAEDGAGNVSSVTETVSVEGNLKLGNFTLSFTDLSIPVSGIPITVTRTYDSLNAHQTDDFGYGWRLEFRDTDLRTSLGRDDQYEHFGVRSQAFDDNTRVYITVPGGERQGFTFAPKGDRLNRFFGAAPQATLYNPAFEADAGVTSTLTVRGNHRLNQGSDGGFYGLSGAGFNPADPLFGGVYILTTKEGIVYEIDGKSGDLLTVKDTNGNTLTFTDGGIFSDTG
jgi:hypothetical protein